jgi:hypothetical protein
MLCRIMRRSSTLASRSFAKSPCAIIAIREKWSRLMPRMRSISRLTCDRFSIARPPGRVNTARASCRVVPSPRFFRRAYRGLRKIR